MEETSLLLLKPDFLRGLKNKQKRFLDVKKTILNMIRFYNLNIIQEDYINIDRTTLLEYQSGMRPKNGKKVIDFSLYSLKDFEPWQKKILKFQTGKYLNGKEHLMIVLKGLYSIQDCLEIKKVIREDFISTKTKTRYINLIHSEDSQQEALQTIKLFSSRIIQGENKKHFINQK